jgi:hypothetical protein
MIAMDDFETFKKIMVKRNIELQLEALKAFDYEYSLRKSTVLSIDLTVSSVFVTLGE